MWPWISEIERRDKGSPRRWGSSHASAFTWTTRLGGKEGWSPAPRLLVEARQTGQAEPFAPLADHLPRCVEARGDGIVGEALGWHKDDLGTNHAAVRSRILADCSFQLLLFFLCRY